MDAKYRYLVFGWFDCEAIGGMSDCVYRCDDINRALLEAKKTSFDIAHIYDCVAGEVIFKRDDSNKFTDMELNK